MFSVFPFIKSDLVDDIEWMSDQTKSLLGMILFYMNGLILTIMGVGLSFLAAMGLWWISVTVIGLYILYGIARLIYTIRQEYLTGRRSQE